MGSNRRYAAYFDRQMDNKILQRIAEENPLQSLTPEELQQDTLPITRDPKPKPCKAWVRFGPHAMLVDAVVVVWNDIACGVSFTVGEKEMRCWVWANAVSPIT
ncbi:hypothetical protein ACFVSU_07605 [Microbacterium sp. NPDC058062]|uniref:hypothetical protein n=1 Tax=Microbacterium sp. NPDC058062 TaxID=3346320 RepID=UPI0036DF1720